MTVGAGIIAVGLLILAYELGRMKGVSQERRRWRGPRLVE